MFTKLLLTVQDLAQIDTSSVEYKQRYEIGKTIGDWIPYVVLVIIVIIIIRRRYRFGGK